MTPEEGEKFHAEFKPPPQGTATGIGNQEQIVRVQDEAFDQEQLQHRLTAFQDSWPKLQKWFNKFGTLKTVDGTQGEETVYLEIEKILEDIINKVHISRRLHYMYWISGH